VDISISNVFLVLQQVNMYIAIGFDFGSTWKKMWGSNPHRERTGQKNDFLKVWWLDRPPTADRFLTISCPVIDCGSTARKRCSTAATHRKQIAGDIC
jgi:hypothetical protein